MGLIGARKSLLFSLALLLLTGLHGFIPAHSGSGTDRITASYTITGNAFLLDSTGEIVKTRLHVVSTKPFLARLLVKKFYLNCSWPLRETPVIRNYSDGYLLSTQCYLELPALWRFNGTVVVYNTSSGAYRVIVSLRLNAFYELNTTIPFESNEQTALLRIADSDLPVYRILRSFNITLVILANRSRVLVNGSLSTFNPFFITYPVNRLEAYELEKSGRRLYYAGIPIRTTIWESREDRIPSKWLKAYSDVLLGKSYLEEANTLLTAQQHLWFISPLYRDTPLMKYLALAPFLSEKIVGKVVAGANSSGRYGVDFVYNYHSIRSGGVYYSSDADLVVLYRGHYPFHFFYVPVPVPPRLKPLGGHVLVLFVKNVYYRYPANIEPYNIDIGPVPETREEASQPTIVVSFLVLVALLGIVVIRVWRAWRR